MSQYIYNDGKIKSRLIRKDKDWFIAEWKSAIDGAAQWFPWIGGTADYLGLSEQDKAWAK
jgi:hypothetical protein